MIHHIDFGVSDFARSLDFYTCAPAPLGLTPFMDRSGAGRAQYRSCPGSDPGIQNA